MKIKVSLFRQQYRSDELPRLTVCAFGRFQSMVESKALATFNDYLLTYLLTRGVDISALMITGNET